MQVNEKIKIVRADGTTVTGTVVSSKRKNTTNRLVRVPQVSFTQAVLNKANKEKKVAVNEKVKVKGGLETYPAPSLVAAVLNRRVD